MLPYIVLGLCAGAAYSLASMGLVLTYKTTGIFNFAYGGVAMFCAFTFWQLRDRWHWNQWLALAFLAAGATVLAYAWYFEGVAALGAGAAAGYISLVPVFGVVFAALWLGERVDASILVGGPLAVGGMAVMNLARR